MVLARSCGHPQNDDGEVAGGNSCITRTTEMGMSSQSTKLITEIELIGLTNATFLPLQRLEEGPVDASTWETRPVDAPVAAFALFSRQHLRVRVLSPASPAFTGSFEFVFRLELELWTTLLYPQRSLRDQAERALPIVICLFETR